MKPKAGTGMKLYVSQDNYITKEQLKTFHKSIDTTYSYIMNYDNQQFIKKYFSNGAFDVDKYFKDKQ